MSSGSSRACCNDRQQQKEGGGQGVEEEGTRIPDRQKAHGLRKSDKVKVNQQLFLLKPCEEREVEGPPPQIHQFCAPSFEEGEEGER